MGCKWSGRGLRFGLASLAIEAILLRNEVVCACYVGVVSVYRGSSVEFTHDSKVLCIDGVEGGFSVTPLLVCNAIA